MNAERDYDDIPGTYVFDGEHYRHGYRLNMFCKSLDIEAARAAFRAEPEAYLHRFDMTPAQAAAVMNRDFLALLRLGGNIYYTFKLAIFDGMTMQHMSAAMSEGRMNVEEFREMMVKGGRPIEGNRSRREWTHG